MINITKRLFIELERLDYVKKIVDMNDVFFDEPKIYSYSISFKMNNCIYDKNTLIREEDMGGAGVSSVCREQALLKCISETIERISLFSCNKEKLHYNSYVNMLDRAINMKFYLNKIKKKNFFLNWTKGFSLNKNKVVYIPSQLIYSNYNLNSEPKLGLQISTGAAGGLTKDECLLRGIYEVVERDVLMTIFLNRIQISKIDLKTIKNKKIQNLINSISRYNLKLFLFDMTNDLNIPTYLALLIDESKQGPYARVGYKTNINSYEAIIGSIEESIISRVALRYNDFFNKLPTIKHPSIRRFNFLINQKAKKIIPTSIKFKTVVLEKEYLIEHLNRLGHACYCADISLNNFKKLGHYVYKVLIPSLQPYLPNLYKEYREYRLCAVAKYFGQKNTHKFRLPFPFL